MITIGTNNIEKIYLGDIVISKVYVGENLVFPSGVLCNLTLNNGDIIEIRGSKELKSKKIAPYKDLIVSAEITEKCTTIGSDAFYNCRNLTSVTISNTVTSINNKAFNFCTSLQRVEIPNSVTSIGSGVFYHCTSLTDVVIANGITSITDEMFLDCTNLTSVTIPNSVTSIGVGAFGYCTSLTSVGGIGSGAMIEIPDSVISIGGNAFGQCHALQRAEIPNSVTSIGRNIFDYCASLTDLVIGDNITVIENETFKGCSSLTSVTIPNSATRIGVRAFLNCRSLSTISIPDSVISIDDEAFVDCGALKSMTIGTGLTNVGRTVFLNCTSLTSITVDAANPKYDSRDNCAALVETSTNSIILGTENTIIPNTVTKIADYAFYGLGITSIGSVGSGAMIEIPDTVTSISNSAFGQCLTLTDVYIPSTITDFPNGNPFVGCTSLTSITVDAANPNYDSRDNCNAIIETSTDKLISICCDSQIPITVKVIGQESLAYSNLEEINLSENVTKIEWGAFRDNENLTRIYIPSTVNEIVIRPDVEGTVQPGGLFANTPSLTSITVDAANPNYDSRDNCNAIIESSTNTLISGCKTTIIPNTIESIGDYAFYKCANLGNITIPDSVKSVNYWSFNSCNNVTSIVFGSGVTYLGERSFAHSSGYESLVIPSTLSEIGKHVFLGCIGIKNVTIGSGVERIGPNAFEGCRGLETINSLATTAPIINTGTFAFIKPNGILYVPSGCKDNYSQWMRTDFYYLGRYEWVCVEQN